MSNIVVFNTLTGQKEKFVPISGNQVKMYACGPTVYDMSHLGHARMAIVWDVVQRYLRYAGYDLTYVRNITDVDDKIINRARDMGTTPEQVAREYTYSFWRDMHELNVESPDVEPRCTEYISLMIEFIQGLIEKGSAYVAGQDVYFDVASFKEYGKLGKKELDDLISGARELVRSQEDLAERKKNPVDFALWKGTAETAASWNSPWGYGRPGWHLECSTMTKHVLGPTIDIHAGGEDLVFPHHENEIAQSESLHGVTMAKYWLHNSFVQVTVFKDNEKISEKMAKSAGNFSTIHGLLQEFSADTIRLFILQTHYRHPIDFSLESLASTRTAMARLLRAAAISEGSESQNGNQGAGADPGQFVRLLKERKDYAGLRDLADDEFTKQFVHDFEEAMNNDFNTAIASSLLFTVADKIFQDTDDVRRRAYAKVLVSYGRLLGLTFQDTRRFIDTATGEKVLDLVLELRGAARGRKDYQTADLIRKQLGELGISVMDTAGGASWEKE